ncbi:hypothetical protein SAMN05443246_0684 [Paenibacillus sp. GP183]|jgi:hypothetical protein|nr:hypothetical protein SAMN05443246_0684 [Paenibacillus sp. GP183]
MTLHCEALPNEIWEILDLNCNCYSSRRYGGWLVTMVKEDRTVDMESLPALDLEGFGW